MVNDVAGPTVRVAGLPSEGLTHLLVTLDATMRVSWAALTPSDGMTMGLACLAWGTRLDPTYKQEPNE